MVGAALAAAGGGLARPARAQLAASLQIASDERLRGLSFSDGRPVAALNLVYDDRSGVYAGLTGVMSDTAHDGVQAIGYQADIGYARRLGSEVSLDVGATNASFVEHQRYRYSQTYSEAYAGLAWRDLSAHLYYSPNYLGSRTQTLYAELEGAIRPAPIVRLFAHVGRLTPLNAPDASNFYHAQYDFSAGVAVQIKSYEARLSWSGLRPGVEFPTGQRQARDALVAGATVFF